MVNPSHDSVITITGLKKKFGDFTAVDGLNFDISRNEIFGLLGPNGAGKTTTINMICGLLPPSEGHIHFHGKENTTFNKSLIGYCPQENIYYPKLTCLEQLLFMGHMYGLSSKSIKYRALELLELLGLTDKINTRASKLSGGMKRRLNICLALVHGPEILILDEPEAGLDPQSRILVRDFIKSFGEQKTIILTTHNMDEADRLATRIAIIDYGKLLMLDTPENMKKTVGEGDMLEMVVSYWDEKAVSTFISKLTTYSLIAKRIENSICIKHGNIIEHLPVIKGEAEASGLKLDEIKLRENTLEDVFIHLTGRSLRP
jgi:ABC-2 type transport system ATP-binding protein